MYCRHCQRRRNKPQSHSQAALDYIVNMKKSGISAWRRAMASDEQIDWLLTELDGIEHVEIKAWHQNTGNAAHAGD